MSCRKFITATNRLEICGDCRYPTVDDAEQLCEGITVTHLLMAYSDLGIDPSQLAFSDDANAA